MRTRESDRLRLGRCLELNGQDSQELGLDAAGRGKLEIRGCFSQVHSKDHWAWTLTGQEAWLQKARNR